MQLFGIPLFSLLLIRTLRNNYIYWAGGGGGTGREVQKPDQLARKMGTPRIEGESFEVGVGPCSSEHWETVRAMIGWSV